jgi:hypothetical protein
MVKLVAERGDGIYLIAESDSTDFHTEGWIYNEGNNSLSRKQLVQSFLKFGYWNEPSPGVDRAKIEQEAEALIGTEPQPVSD